MTEEWRKAWETDKENDRRKKQPFKVGEAVWVRATIPDYCTSAMFDYYDNLRFAGRIKAHHPRLWREDRYSVEFANGTTMKIESSRISRCAPTTHEIANTLKSSR